MGDLTQQIFARWSEAYGPMLDWVVLDKLAKEFYSGEFAKAQSNPKLRKNLRDRIGGTVRRHRPAPN